MVSLQSLIFFNERFGVLIFREWVWAQIQNLFFILVFRSFDFLSDLALMVFNEVDALLWFFLDGIKNLYAISSNFEFGLSLSFDELSFEIFLLQLIDRALAPLSFFEFQITGKILNKNKNVPSRSKTLWVCNLYRCYQQGRMRISRLGDVRLSF
jgi:hypothetical protein